MDLALGIVASLVFGLLFWLVPSRVLLTKSAPHSPDGLDEYDTWLVRNGTGHEVLITKVELRALGDVVDASHELTFVDSTLEMRREVQHYNWENVVVPVGEPLRAHVNVNHDMTITYRPAGLLGALRRKRHLAIHGFA